MFVRSFYDLTAQFLFKQDPKGRYWCSTKTGKRGKRKDQHLKGGNWGYCQPGCDSLEIIETTTARITTKPTKRRRQQCRKNKGQCICEGIYCDEKFWEKIQGK